MDNNNINTAFRDLTREWVTLARSPRAARALAAWSTTGPALASIASLASFGERRSNEVLAALLRVGDDLARRAFLQAMLPGLVGVTRMGLEKRRVGHGRVWRHPAAPP